MIFIYSFFEYISLLFTRISLICTNRLISQQLDKYFDMFLGYQKTDNFSYMFLGYHKTDIFSYMFLGYQKTDNFSYMFLGYHKTDNFSYMFLGYQKKYPNVKFIITSSEYEHFFRTKKN
jgi:hypothetical protein